MPITNNTTTITAAYYNQLLDLVKTSLTTCTTGYGQEPQSLPVGRNVIEPQHWLDLFSDLNRITIHQTGQPLDSGSLITPQSGGLVRRDFINFLDGAASTSTASIYTVAPNQLVQTSTSTSRTTSWSTGTGQGIRMIVDTIWPGSDSVYHYFNLGGQLVTDLSREVGSDAGSPNPDLEAAIATLLDTNRSNLQITFDRTLWQTLLASTASIYQWTTSTVIGTPPNEGVFTATVSFELITSDTTDDTLRTTLQILPDSNPLYAGEIRTNVTGTLTNFSSTGDSGGIAGPLHFTETALTFEDAPAPTEPRRSVTLSLSDTTAPIVIAKDVSQTYPIQITNSDLLLGATTATVTDLVFTSFGGTATFSPPLPYTIPPGSTQTVVVQYSKTVSTIQDVGTFTNSVRVISNNSKGDVIAPLTLVVELPTVEVTPTQVEARATLTNYTSIYQNFQYSTRFGTIIGFGTPQITGPGSTAFALETAPVAASPGARFRYNPVSVATVTNTARVVFPVAVRNLAGATSTVLSSTATWIVDQRLSDVHIGDWTSALAPNNSVVGISYDLIGGRRVVTFGLGMGADGAPTLANGGSPYVNVRNLDFRADPNYLSGPPLYKTPGYLIAGVWTQFLKDYGVWFTPAANINVSNFYTGNYLFTVPTTGTYYLSFTVDDAGYVAIDGTRLIDLTSTYSPFTNVYTVPVTLTAGQHTITLGAVNYWAQGAVAATIGTTPSTTGPMIWTTLTQTKPGVYQYWGEVYRVVLDAVGPATYYVDASRLVKDISLFSTGGIFGLPTRYSSAFSIDGRAQNMFAISDDGNGNLDIRIGGIGQTNDPTVNHLANSFHYYDGYTTYGARYTQLESSPTLYGTNSYFRGFTAAGAVITSLRATAVPQPPVISTFSIGDRSGPR